MRRVERIIEQPFAGIINRAGVESYIRGFKKFVIEKVG